ncbi:MAG: hypothetical protein RR743_00885, partial [Oscillospiraceae bacterium]
MKSIYFKNFVVTATLVIFSFFVLALSFVILGRSVAISEKRESISINATEVSKAAAAFSESGSLTSWHLRLIITSLASSTGNNIFITDPYGTIISCSDFELTSP